MSERLDVALVRRGLARSRAVASAAIRDGRVTIDGDVATRAAQPVAQATVLHLDEPRARVGRGGQKLEAALDAFAVAVAGRTALDLGASTGGFTEVLLENGADRVVALDVGHDQLAPALRADPRVVVVEGVNARDLDAAALAALSGSAAPPDVVVADLSFISLRLVVGAIAAVAAADADVIVLIKPQFEVGRGRVPGGVVTDVDARREAVAGVLDAAWTVGLGVCGLIRSPIAGAAGNLEVLAHLQAAGGRHPAQWSGRTSEVVRADGRETA